MSSVIGLVRRSLLAVVVAVCGLGLTPAQSAGPIVPPAASTATSTARGTTAATGEPGVDCTPQGGPALSMATEIRDQQLRLAPFKTWRLPADPTWREDPFHDVNWVFRYQSLRMVLPLIRTWHRTGDSWYRQRAVFLTRDWIADNPRSDPASPVAWSDLATAWRAMVLACIVQAVPGATWARTALAQHGALLAKASFYRWHGNHALGQDRGLIAAGCTLQRSEWVRLASDRLARLVVESVDSQGASNEQAVYYQYYNWSGYDSAAARLVRCGHGVPASLARIDRMPTFLAHATLPDGTYAMLGDTVRRSAVRIDGTDAAFAASGGTVGRRPTAVFARYDAGFIFGRSGWGEQRAFRDEAMYTMRFGPGRRFHGHAEHGSLTLYANGKRLIDDSGAFTMNSDKWRAYALGRAAHNVVTVDGVRYDTSSVAKLSRARTDARRDDVSILDRGYDGVALRRRVVFSRKVGYLVVEDRVASRSSHTVRQLWHLDVGAAPVVSGRTVRSSRAAGNVRIIQLAVRPTVRIAAGRKKPIQGWISETLGHRRPAPVVEAVARGRSVRYLTLVVPTRDPDARVVVSDVKLTRAGWSFDIDVAGVREHVQATATDSAITSR